MSTPYDPYDSPYNNEPNQYGGSSDPNQFSYESSYSSGFNAPPTETSYIPNQNFSQYQGVVQPEQTEQPNFSQNPTQQTTTHVHVYNNYTGAIVPTYIPKSKIAAGFLAFFLGFLGIHNFYAGRTTLGVIELVVFIVSWPLIPLFFFGLVPLGLLRIWTFLEMIFYFCGVGSYAYDGNGQPMA